MGDLPEMALGTVEEVDCGGPIGTGSPLPPGVSSSLGHSGKVLHPRTCTQVGSEELGPTPPTIKEQDRAPASSLLYKSSSRLLADFISIDCGITGNTNYTHGKTDILYVSDDQFTDTGINHQVASNYVSSSLDELLLTVRSFPNASRSCYVLKPVIQYRKYIVRATFMYGNYDGLNRANVVKPLLFDLYMEVNFWQTVNVSDPKSIYEVEAMAVALADSVSVCLVDTGSGTPFISAPELRPLVDAMYPSANTSQSLVLNYRLNVGPSRNSSALRYPDDPYDRIWRPWTRPDAWMEISTTETISNSAKNLFQPSTTVMQTAATPSGNSLKMEFYWTFADAQVPNNEFYVNLFFTEFERNTSRLFNVYLNDELLTNYTPPYGSVGYLFSSRPLDPASEYHWALNSMGLSTLPPILNAIEVFTAMHLTLAATASGDGTFFPSWMRNCVACTYLVSVP
ncbi:unnamed protein product [Musa acuminata var. zebrina]